MASQKDDAYMVSHRQGDAEEDRRLDAQHEMLKYAICRGKILHPLIPSHDIKTVADVGTGTGVWMNDFVRTFRNDSNSSSLSLVGFDVTDARFTKNPEPGVEFVVHNGIEPFAPSYHGKFDLVNVRLVNYAIPRQSFPSLVENVAQLLRA
jgi:SAM-dependent methyltransferase